MSGVLHLTAPSKYHATTKAGYRNSKWNGPARRTRRAINRPLGAQPCQAAPGRNPHFRHTCCRAPSRRNAALAHAYVHAAGRCRARAPIIRDYAWKEDHHELRSDKAKSTLSPRPLTRKKAVLPAMSLNTFPKILTVMLSMVRPMTKAANY
jgi:hypothetical protein